MLGNAKQCRTSYNTYKGRASCKNDNSISLTTFEINILSNNYVHLKYNDI